jgi:hypothetical protein
MELRGGGAGEEILEETIRNLLSSSNNLPSLCAMDAIAKRSHASTTGNVREEEEEAAVLGARCQDRLDEDEDLLLSPRRGNGPMYKLKDANIELCGIGNLPGMVK